jgi:hypothetical protein
MPMPLETPTVSQISLVMVHATAPAFLLGATGSFVALLAARFNVIIDRSRAIHGIKDQDHERLALKADIPRLKARARLLQRAIAFGVASSICTTLLIAWSFGAAFIGFNHEAGAAALFVLSLFLFAVALMILAREVRMGLNELDHFP